MTAATPRRYGTVASDDNRPTILWLIVMAGGGTPPTSPARLGPVGRFVGGENPQHSGEVLWEEVGVRPGFGVLPRGRGVSMDQSTQYAAPRVGGK